MYIFANIYIHICIYVKSSKILCISLDFKPSALQTIILKKATNLLREDTHFNRM